MEKVDSLRAALVAAIPELAVDRERLVIFVDKGRLVSRRTASLGYEWRYTVRLEFRDFTKSPDAIAVPLLLWIRDNQPELVSDFAREDSAIGFAADIIDETTWDVAVAFDLNEAVDLIPRPDGSGWDVTHRPEPLVDDLLLDGASEDVRLGEIWLDGEKIVP